MSSTGAGYDLGCNIYSPDGRIYQVEYANKAVENSGSVIALKCKDGVVVGVEKLLMSKLLVQGSGRRVHTIDNHAGLAYAGYLADGRAIVSAAINECANYKDQYGCEIPPHVLSNRIGHYMHAHTTYGGYRPFGLCVIMLAHDNKSDESFVHMCDPSGVHHRFYGVVVGKAKQAAKTEIEKLDLENITCREALKRIALIIRTIREEDRDKPMEFEASWITEETNGEHQAVPLAIRKEADEWAIKRREEIDMDED